MQATFADLEYGAKKRKTRREKFLERMDALMLRLVNAGDATAQVTINGVDDNGAAPNSAVRLQLPAGMARTLTAGELETGGGVGLTGALGDGAGKWELTVEADREIHVLSLMRGPTGRLTNLSSKPLRH